MTDLLFTFGMVMVLEVILALTVGWAILARSTPWVLLAGVVLLMNTWTLHSMLTHWNLMT